MVTQHPLCRPEALRRGGPRPRLAYCTRTPM